LTNLGFGFFSFDRQRRKRRARRLLTAVAGHLITVAYAAVVFTSRCGGDCPNESMQTLALNRMSECGDLFR
jgi:hypothetical protein